MSKEFFDYDPWTGLAYYTEQDGPNTIVRTEQDCSPVLEHTMEKRNSGSGDKRIAGHMNHYADIPNGVALQLMQKDINIFNLRKGDFPKLAREIEQNYPYLKVTDKKAWRPR